ncbi:hypothetical protein M3215_11595 [Bacillus cytotoxicus]|uniref:Uncharacterized protein n=1 Tax=Bacillus cytotoxicus TaxID=580165 RepID=A0ACC6A878_9BACI|nr:hypothetical protein [Bacillus cytotoxicus]
MKKITLLINDKEKTFNPPAFVPGLLGRKAAELEDKYLSPTGQENNKATQSEVLDTFVDFVCLAYGNVFTPEEFYNGIDSRKMYTTIMELLSGITKETAEAAGGETVPNE